MVHPARITHVCVCLHVKKQLLTNCVNFRLVEVICVVLKMLILLVVILLVSFC